MYCTFIGPALPKDHFVPIYRYPLLFHSSLSELWTRVRIRSVLCISASAVASRVHRSFHLTTPNFVVARVVIMISMVSILHFDLEARYLLKKAIFFVELESISRFHTSPSHSQLFREVF